MGNRILRCTVCGLMHKESSEVELLTCEACGNQYLASDGIFLSQKTQKEIDILKNLRIRLDDMIKVNDAKMILSHSQDILKILPDDFLGSYFYAYAAHETRQPKFLYQFFNQKELHTTDAHLRQVTQHMVQYVDIKEYELILKFIQIFDPSFMKEAKLSLKKRIQLEDQYTIVKRDVFICHRSTDYESLLQVVIALESDGYSCWYSERNLRPDDNENYWKNIEEAIDHSTVFLVISSQSAMLSKDVQRELQYANKKNKHKLEYKIDDSVHTTLFKHSFDGLKWIDAHKIDQLDQVKQRIYAYLNETQHQQIIEANSGNEMKTNNYFIDKKNSSSSIKIILNKRKTKIFLGLISLLILSVIGFFVSFVNTDEIKFSQVVLSYNHSIFLSKEGDVYTSGDNDQGQLGIGKMGSGNINLNYVDIPLNNGENILDIEAGWNFSTVLTTEGRIFTWGDNATLKLGIGNTQLFVDSPIDTTLNFKFLMNSNEKIIKISSGAFSSIAITNLNRVITWGDGYSYGLANVSMDYTNVDAGYPIDVTAAFDLDINEEIVKIYAKGTYFGLLTSAGKLFFWGQDPKSKSFLGSETNTVYAKPFQVSIPNALYLEENEKIVDFSIGDTFALIVTNKNRLLTLGQNYANQLGTFLPLISESFEPIDVSVHFNLKENESVSKIFLGYDFGYIITSDNRIIVWGSNYLNAIFLNDNIKANSPYELTLNGDKILDISFNVVDNYFAYITDKNELYMWGNNNIVFNGFDLKNTVQKIS